VTAIDIRSVTKQFGSVTAVNALDLTVPGGSIYGFIGPNGSGKTKTIRMIMDILRPDSGEIVLFEGASPASARARIGYLPEERGLYKRMTVRQVLRYYGRLKNKPLSQLDPSISEWLGRLQLTAWADKRVQALSKGMAQKVQFISAVISKPELLILDEPFSGLDPVNADALRDAVLSLRGSGTTIVFSTHDMSAAERLCDRVFMIFKGKKVLDGTLAEIHRQYGQDTIRIRLAAGAAPLSRMPDVESMTDHGNYQDVRLKGGDAQTFLRRLVEHGGVEQFEIAKPSLHDLFVRIARPTAEDLRAEAVSSS